MEVLEFGIMGFPAHSRILRDKVFWDCEKKNGSRREIAERYGVSVSFVYKMMARYRATEKVDALPHGGGRKRICNTLDLKVLRVLVNKHPQATLTELCRLYSDSDRGKTVSVPTMSRLLKRLGLQRKKTAAQHKKYT